MIYWHYLLGHRLPYEYKATLLHEYNTSELEQAILRLLMRKDISPLGLLFMQKTEDA